MLSFMNKISSGYWDLFDPTNGYTAIHRAALLDLPLEKISKRYFFETDMLFRLNLSRAVAMDIPMRACYGDEISGLKIRKILPEFIWKHFRNTLKRIFYLYYLRDFSIASVELLAGVGIGIFSLIYSGTHWWEAYLQGKANSAGVVVLGAVSLLSSLHLMLGFLNFDISAIPRHPLSTLLNQRETK
jgi:hypothetical protein